MKTAMLMNTDHRTSYRFLRPGLQADLRRRQGTKHRRDGQLLAGPRLRGHRDRGDHRRRCTGRSWPRWRPCGRTFHGVLYAGLMIGCRGSQGARVQHPPRGSRDPGCAAAAALGPARALPGNARAGRAGRDGGGSSAMSGPLPWCSPAADYPRSPSHGRGDPRA